MKIGLLISQQTGENVKLNLDEFNNYMPTWGSCHIWGRFPVDNIICNNINTTRTLVSRNVQKQTNLFVPQKHITQLGNPANLKGFQGEFKDTNINNKDDIIGMNITSSIYDIILMFGFKFAKSKSKDKLETYKQNAYLYNVHTIIKENSDKQFVLVNHKGKLSADFEALDNFTKETLTNTIKLIKEIS